MVCVVGSARIGSHARIVRLAVLIALCVTILCWMSVASLICVMYKVINENGSSFSFMCRCNTDV